MKKFVSAALAACVVFGATACGTDMSKAPAVEVADKGLLGMLVKVKSQSDKTTIKNIKIFAFDEECKFQSYQEDDAGYIIYTDDVKSCNDEYFGGCKPFSSLKVKKSLSHGESVKFWVKGCPIIHGVHVKTNSGTYEFEF